jgi:hypothetical protein
MHPHPLRAAVRILLLALSALIVFGTTAFLGSSSLLWLKTNANAIIGITMLCAVCGLSAWLFVVVLHSRVESLTFLHDDREAVALWLRRELEQLGYGAGEPHKGRTFFKPCFTAYLAGGSVQMMEHPGNIVISGPKVFIELLRKRLKVLHHLASVQQTIRETRVRQGRHLLRRVEIDLRVSAAQWQKIYDDVISVLAAQDAALVCEVHILAQNESGILDTTVEAGIRERLRQQNIPVEIRKEARPKERALAAVGAT